MTAKGATRHLGLDLGATNIKWAVVEHAATRGPPGRDQVATPISRRTRPRCLPRSWQLAEVAAAADRRDGPVCRAVGIGVPGLYDPATGTTRFLVNVPGPWGGSRRRRPRWPTRSACRPSSINDARAFGLAELRLGAGRGAVVDDRTDARDGRRRRDRDRRPVVQGHDGTAGELGHQTIDPDGPWCGCGNRGCLEAFARADQIAAACGTATAEEAVVRARAGDERAIGGLAEVGRYLGIGIANMVVVLSPDRVVIGGGISAAADLLLGPIRDELRRRVRTTSLDEVELVTAELGTWAGAIGAAVHGAEAATRRSSWPKRPRAPGTRRSVRDDRGELPAAVPPDRAGPARADRDAAARRAPAVGRRAVRPVRGEPDDRAQRDGAARRRRPDPARTGTRQLRRRAAGASAGQLA